MNPLGRNMFNLAERRRIIDLALQDDCAVDSLQEIIRLLQAGEAVTIEQIKRQLTSRDKEEMEQSIQFLLSWGMIEPFGHGGVRLTVPSSM